MDSTRLASLRLNREEFVLVAIRRHDGRRLCTQPARLWPSALRRPRHRLEGPTSKQAFPAPHGRPRARKPKIWPHAGRRRQCRRIRANALNKIWDWGARKRGRATNPRTTHGPQERQWGSPSKRERWVAIISQRHKTTFCRRGLGNIASAVVADARLGATDPSSSGARDDPTEAHTATRRDGTACHSFWGVAVRCGGRARGRESDARRLAVDPNQTRRVELGRGPTVRCPGRGRISDRRQASGGRIATQEARNAFDARACIDQVAEKRLTNDESNEKQRRRRVDDPTTL